MFSFANPEFLYLLVILPVVAGLYLLERWSRKHIVRLTIVLLLLAMAVIILVGIFISWKYVWIVGAPAGILSTPIGKSVQKRQYKSLIEKMNK